MSPIEGSAGIIFLSTALANNLVLESQLALDPLFATTRRMAVATSMALISLIAMTFLGLISYFIFTYVLLPLNVTYFSLLFLLLVQVVILQGAQVLLRFCWPEMEQKYGVFFPLLTWNCAMLGLVLLMLDNVSSFSNALIFCLGSACGFGLLLVIFAGLRERLALAQATHLANTEKDVPSVFKGIPLMLITLGILSMAFHGF